MTEDEAAAIQVSMGMNFVGMIGSLNRYRDDHVELGGFLTAVLRNDLLDAVCRADPSSLGNIKAIVQHCQWELPGDSWGSPEAVKAWLKLRPFPVTLDVDDPEASRNIQAERMP